MEVYRISKCAYINDLSGTGARLYGGRWNSPGHAVVYTAGSRALSALEVLVHIPLKNIVQDFCIATIHIPDHIAIKALTKDDLPSGWQSLTPSPQLQCIGDEWVDTAKYAALRIPSVVIADEFNYLINPLHPEAAEITIVDMQPFVFDQRLKK
ncbi:RES family NAD+ phosphorylase [Chitinophaga nivalis]|uniref:RES family NAD+ phosphorylase n=1 Tax=Chitinophaga nivalis TaxID=2991709 RepID=A0ABT3IFC4_9BACT|nr:RES family NAD+ phosphorylase [Chitinophaga nivalis]MCW3467692.1 RES family NAD+ phosphorylase [Chitinophaga nivalis]MCW3482616.1 RES family NAD+ phosphorylase [Chitinophaga nivalis]